MTELLINLLDGTVCDYRGCVVVETDTLNEEGKALLEEWHHGGNDGTASELGEKYGIEIEKYASNPTNPQDIENAWWWATK